MVDGSDIESIMSPEERAKHAKGKMILLVGIIMITLFFGVFLSLMTYSATAM